MADEDGVTPPWPKADPADNSKPATHRARTGIRKSFGPAQGVGTARRGATAHPVPNEAPAAVLAVFGNEKKEKYGIID